MPDSRSHLWICMAYAEDWGQAVAAASGGLLDIGYVPTEVNESHAEIPSKHLDDDTEQGEAMRQARDYGVSVVVSRKGK